MDDLITLGKCASWYGFINFSCNSYCSNHSLSCLYKVGVHIDSEITPLLIPRETQHCRFAFNDLACTTIAKVFKGM